MLEENMYLRCLLIDVSKAFDSMDHVILINKLIHVILINKLKLLNLLDNIIKWVASFSTDRDQVNKVGDNVLLLSL